MALDPKYAYAWNGLGNALRAQKKLDEAVKAYNQAIALDPKDAASPYFNLGVLRDDQGNVAEALRLYQEALNQPNNPGSSPASAHAMAYTARGFIYLRQKQPDPERALLDFQRALAIDPTYRYALSGKSDAEGLLKPQVVALTDRNFLDQMNPWTAINRSVVRVRVEFKDAKKPQEDGTGWIIKREGAIAWVVTPRHVVQNQDTQDLGDKFEVEPYYGQKMPLTARPARATAEFIKKTPITDTLDLALLKVTGLPEDMVALSPRPAPLPDKIKAVIIGRTAAGHWRVDPDRECSYYATNQQLVLAITLEEGSSGSPVFDEQKQVIGMMVDGDAKYGQAVPINAVIQQVKQWGVQLP
ncbi:MAG: tetratricopeptide repeat protein [Leptolyngbyaceae cyanobacterium]